MIGCAALHSFGINLRSSADRIRQALPAMDRIDDRGHCCTRTVNRTDGEMEVKMTSYHVRDQLSVDTHGLKGIELNQITMLWS